ncbi:3-phytase A [Golovinomyces cichoracearum]|uniref:Phytase A n=1 Tax=Golovinomyces cichoracearum TaxID=62708 RepID=A0A420HLP7_9PEZI|nr:3-phytase A [Golovinomyces cichoracearum]
MEFLSSVARSSVRSNNHKYGAISESQYELNDSPFTDYYEKFHTEYELKRTKKEKKKWLARIIMGIFGIMMILFYLGSANRRNAKSESCDSVDSGFQCQPNFSHYWGQYSPYFSVPSDINPDVPDQCGITFVQILSRHGARDPTSRKTADYRQLIHEIHKNTTSYNDQYSFIKDYQYMLGADQLSSFGQSQMKNSGIKFYSRYNLIAQKTTPFVRASGQARVIDSAKKWTQGFHQARLQDSRASDDRNYPYKILVISEDPGSNNTLDHGLCRKFEQGPVSDIGKSAKATWASIFAPKITARLNSNMPGVNLTTYQTISFMSLCPFETVAREGDHISPFCGLFTDEEWQAYDYYQTLGKYYKYSSGNPLGPTQGVGFVNELISRMTNIPVKDHTSTNSTLDNDSETFPIGEDTTLYADFSHDNTMISILAALGLYNSTPPLSNSTLLDAISLKGFSTSWTVPFAARTYIEKMKCKDIDGELVRILVNDRVVPLETCGADTLGRCKLSRFIDSLSFAKAGGRWDQC